MHPLNLSSIYSIIIIYNLYQNQEKQPPTYKFLSIYYKYVCMYRVFQFRILGTLIYIGTVGDSRFIFRKKYTSI